MTTQSLRVRGLELGSGDPAVIVPLLADDAHTLLERAHAIADAGPDMVEWRADALLAAEDTVDLDETLGAIRHAIGTLPLLVTVRTAAEGGALEAARPQLVDLYGRLLASGEVDLLDVEVQDRETARDAIATAHDSGVPVLGSHHRFDATPGIEDLVTVLADAADLGADAVKVAVMPQRAEDVLVLLEATLRAQRLLEVPVITMSMGPKGAITRLAGDLVGSAATFAVVDGISAPGQLPLSLFREFEQARRL
jgi:3-dehydroquinate dehydratase-1